MHRIAHYWFYSFPHKGIPVQMSGGTLRLLCWVLLSCSFGRAGGRPYLGEAEGKGEGSLWLAAIKRSFLESLGMDGPPVFREEPQQEELKRMHLLYQRELRQLRQNRSRAGGTPHSADRASTVLLSAEVESLAENPQRFRAVFHKTHLIRRELTLVHAELKLYGDPSRSQSGQPESQQEIQLRVHRMINTTAREPLKKDGLALTKVLDSNSLTIDILPTVQNWRVGSEELLVLEVEFVTRRETHPQGAPEIILEMEVAEPVPGERRKRRRAPVKDDCDEEDRCCRKSLSVSFKDIGWSDWVVAPEGYTMYFCDGSCPHNYKPASMHTQVKSRLHRMTKGATPRPCCVPAAYDPMVIMHYDSQGKLTFTAFDDMIVNSCHCA
ncbi:hypothetical protein AAFF_G00257680 [Aldrovandia affinis]|uniref:Growth/differentiation factor 15 n=1 Tax=Aldrovandia affinis TaxID=143900 RepID=A0AAD7ST31_9TELE|nr:hypothetical protein AAFF_G00257680 [Aldrovandia affinis]